MEVTRLLNQIKLNEEKEEEITKISYKLIKTLKNEQDRIMQVQNKYPLVLLQHKYTNLMELNQEILQEKNRELNKIFEERRALQNKYYEIND